MVQAPACQADPQHERQRPYDQFKKFRKHQPDIQAAEGLSPTEEVLFDRDTPSLFFKRLPDLEPRVFAASQTVDVSTSFASTGTVVMLPSLTEEEPQTTGTIETSLNPVPGETKDPIITSAIATPSTTLTPTGPATQASANFELLETMSGEDIFAEPIATKAPPSNMAIKEDHPVPRKGIASSTPLQTNKFFANFYLSNQAGPTYTFPYSITWANGNGPTASYGMSISHIEADQRVFGENKDSGAASYFINPVGIQYLVISAKELEQDTSLTIDSIGPFSARVHLAEEEGKTPAVSFPLVQGMAFITAQFSGAVPVIQTGVYFRTVTRVTTDPKPNVAKFNMELEDGSTWHLYSHVTTGDQLDLKVVNNGYAESNGEFHGTIQICKDNDGESIYDEGAGIYASSLELTGTTSGIQGTYSFNYNREGHLDGDLIMYALPHHVDSFDQETTDAVTTLQLQTTTKGMATAVRGSKWTMVENAMPVTMEFAPWSPQRGSMKQLSETAKAAILTVASQEISQNMAAQTDLNSMYFSGKVSFFFFLV